jgi:signal transduction histidine kinase
MVNKKLWEIGAFRDVFANLDKFKELQDQGYVRYDGLPLVAADGRKLFVEFVSNVYEVNGGKVIQCNIRDNTERRKVELEKEILNATLAEKNKEIENFLYITTHDLRTPLVNILGFTRNLGKDLEELRKMLEPLGLPDAEKAEVLKLMNVTIPESLGFITGSGQKMNTLIAALLKVSRLGRLEMNVKTVDMNAVLKTVLQTFAYQLETMNAEVKVENLPPCLADAGAVSQFFANLLDNAIKYRNRERKLEITVSGKMKNPGTVLYTVSDNGTGIKTEDLDRIWQVFFSGQQAPGVKKGEGIGLTMAKRMVERSGGRIWAESEEGTGTKFFIELPAKE